MQTLQPMVEKCWRYGIPSNRHEISIRDSSQNYYDISPFEQRVRIRIRKSSKFLLSCQSIFEHVRGKRKLIDRKEDALTFMSFMMSLREVLRYGRQGGEE